MLYATVMLVILNIIRRLLRCYRAWRDHCFCVQQWKAVKPSIDPEKRTYYPNESRKTREEVLEDLCRRWMDVKTRDWTIEMTVENYFMYGLDRKDVDADSFVHNLEYDRARNACQSTMAYMLTFKQVTAIYLRACGVRVTCAIGFVENTLIHAADNSYTTPVQEWFRAETEYGVRHYFVKPADGIQARNCFRLIVSPGEDGPQYQVNGVEAPEAQVLRKCEGCVLEPLLVQHSQLREISPNAVFPVRIRTIRKENGTPDFLSAYMAVGWKASFFTNVTNGGGIGFAVDEHGYGLTDGLLESEPGGKPGCRYQYHPETGVPFKGYHVPMMKEAIELALKAHRALPGIHSIGWDIAILDDGPIVIEGNADWGTTTYQAIVGRGERDVFEKWIKPYPCKKAFPSVYGV